MMHEYPEVSLTRWKINPGDQTALRCSTDGNRNGYRYFCHFGSFLPVAIAVTFARSGVYTGPKRPMDRSISELNEDSDYILFGRR